MAAEKKQPLRRWQDTTGDLRSTYKRVMNKEPDRFKHLQHVKINFTFRDPPEPEEDGKGYVVAGMAKRLSPREVDLYGFHFEIEMAAMLWKKKTDDEKYRLMWHEMWHCQVQMEDDDVTPKLDNCARVKTYCIGHDIMIRTFFEEAERFGLQDHELAEIRKLLAAHELYEKRMRKQAAKKAAAEEEEDEEGQVVKPKKAKKEDDDRFRKKHGKTKTTKKAA